MSKTVTLRVDDATYETFVQAAAAERRSLSNMIETAALQHIRDSEFVDDAEMAEIMGNADLVRRLKRGLADAKKRKGRFVSSL
jgi:predicted transcriptional regulator